MYVKYQFTYIRKNANVIQGLKSRTFNQGREKCVCVCVWGGWSIGKIHNDGVV